LAGKVDCSLADRADKINADRLVRGMARPDWPTATAVGQ
jgi:hypothetical protein